MVVVMSHDQSGSAGRKTSLWLEEFAAPYFVFRDAGVELTLASPKGGQAPLDPKSDLPEDQTPALTRFKQDKEAEKQLSQTVKLSDMKSEDFDISLIQSFYNSGNYVRAARERGGAAASGSRYEI
jgi:putative intracellular protease/amidase